jgi:PKD repeat protein
MNRILIVTLLAWIASAVLAVGVTRAEAVVVPTAPVWPIPPDAPAGPPPITALPSAGDASPPAEQIADPVTPAASCGGWYLQSDYGDRWPAASNWWEYRCTSDYFFYYDPCTGGGACDAFCPSCYVELWRRTDYFYWNGSDAAFYGQDYFYSFYYTQVDWPPPYTISAWWDGPTARWYRLGTSSLTVFKEGNGSGEVTSSPAGIACGDVCAASFDAGTVVTLTATAGSGSTFVGWSGACSGTGTCQVTLDQAHSVTAAFATSVHPNAPPVAAFTFSCSSLSCTVDGSGSADSDGTIASYSWAFGDQSGASGQVAHHSYAGAGTYPVTLTVTDDVGATATVSHSVTVTNASPTASLAVRCTGLICALDGGGSVDPDGTIVNYQWSFGDGTGGTGTTTEHSYPRAGAYAVTLTVADNAGTTAATSQRINPISLSARGYKVGGVQKVDLSWVGPTGTSFEVYRNDTKVATVSTTVYTDSVGKRAGSYRYWVCAPTLSSCSSEATVNF